MRARKQADLADPTRDPDELAALIVNLITNMWRAT